MRALEILFDVVGGADAQAELITEELNKRSDMHVDILYHFLGGNYTIKRKNGDKIVCNTYADAMNELSMNGYDYEIIHAHSPMMAELLPDFMSRLSNPPMIYTAHGIVAKEEGIGKKHTYAIFQEEHCKKAKKITCPSENTKNNLSYYYPEFSKKIEVIYNGTDFTKYANDETVERWSRKLREEYAPNGERIITYVGRLVPEKGVLDLAKAFRMIMDDHDAVLVYCGPYETYQYFANQISYEILPDMKDYVIFTENVNDRKELAAVYKASDAVVIPSYSETFSLAAIEAMAMGSPVVISDVDAPRELFVNNGMAIGVQPGNIESIRQGIDYVLSNREESMIRSSLDQQKIVEKYSIEAVSNRWMNTYLSVAAASC